jgi:hypothetical protein
MFYITFSHSVVDTEVDMSNIDVKPSCDVMIHPVCYSSVYWLILTRVEFDQ